MGNELKRIKQLKQEELECDKKIGVLEEEIQKLEDTLILKREEKQKISNERDGKHADIRLIEENYFKPKRRRNSIIRKAKSTNPEWGIKIKEASDNWDDNEHDDEIMDLMYNIATLSDSNKVDVFGVLDDFVSKITKNFDVEGNDYDD